MKANTILETIGNTPHIRIQRLFPGAEVWIDDVAVSDQPIPCPTGMPSKP